MACSMMGMGFENLLIGYEVVSRLTSDLVIIIRKFWGESIVKIRTKSNN